MCRIGQNVEQVLIAPGASAILWWTIALSADAGRIERRLAWQRAFFDDDRMFPVVAEVVSVDEAGDAGFQQAVQGQAIFVGDVVNGVAIAVLPAADVEGVEMLIMPTHRGLDCLMQVTQRHLVRHEEATPDRRSRAAQGHLQADDALAGTSSRLDGLGHDRAPCRLDASPSRFLRGGSPDGKWAIPRAGASSRRVSGGCTTVYACRVFRFNQRLT